MPWTRLEERSLSVEHPGGLWCVTVASTVAGQLICLIRPTGEPYTVYVP
jgi:hypothetical protein